MGATKPTPIPSNNLTAGEATKNLGSGHHNHVNNDHGDTALTGFSADLSVDRRTTKIPPPTHNGTQEAIKFTPNTFNNPISISIRIITFLKGLVH